MRIRKLLAEKFVSVQFLLPIASFDVQTQTDIKYLTELLETTWDMPTYNCDMDYTNLTMKNWLACHWSPKGDWCSKFGPSKASQWDSFSWRHGTTWKRLFSLSTHRTSGCCCPWSDWLLWCRDFNGTRKLRSQWDLWKLLVCTKRWWYQSPLWPCCFYLCEHTKCERTV